jgi:hypothetical protein
MRGRAATAWRRRTLTPDPSPGLSRRERGNGEAPAPRPLRLGMHGRRLSPDERGDAPDGEARASARATLALNIGIAICPAPLLFFLSHSYLLAPIGIFSVCQSKCGSNVSGTQPVIFPFCMCVA